MNRAAKFCDQCGAKLPVLVVNPYAPPIDGLGERPDVSTGLPLASRGARLGAALIDAFAVALGSIPIAFLVGVARRGVEMTWIDRAGLAGFAFAVFVLVQVWSLADGRTIGKRAFGLRMVAIDTDKPPPPSRLIALRYLPGMLLSLVPFGGLVSLLDTLMIFRSDRRCLHDLIAGTRVVHDPQREE
jgi:uncharacterized RDD family membrane protein YckC